LKRRVADLAFVAGRLKNGLIETMTAEQILKEIEALPEAERQRLVERMREATSTNIPEDFIDALEDFDKGRFISMDTALNETPPDA
jgi:hypothetical protein